MLMSSNASNPIKKQWAEMHLCLVCVWVIIIILWDILPGYSCAHILVYVCYQLNA